ncbi:hypothetical protein Q5752_003004 [Cryptotrichosporon argae]
MSRPALLSLPAELLALIASHLDVPSALCLNLTHSSFSSAASARIWNTVHPGDPYWAHERGLYACVRLPAPAEGTADWPCSSTIRRYFHHLCALLRERPERAAFVKHLELDMGYLVPPELADFLVLTGHSLRTLSMGYPLVVSSPARYPAEAHVSLAQLFTRSGPLPALRRAEISIVQDWDASVRALLRAAPALVALKINSHLPSRVTGSTAATAPIDGPGLPRLALESLVVDTMRANFEPCVTAIVRAAPELKFVALRAPTFLWRPAADGEIWAALGALPQLERLEITSDSLSELAVPGRFPALRDLAVLWKAAHVPSDAQSVSHGEPPAPSLPAWTPVSLHGIDRLAGEPRLVLPRHILARSTGSAQA